MDRADHREADRRGGTLVTFGCAPVTEPAALRPCNRPRSPFLAQLSRQYESRDEALQRRDDARGDAERSYGRAPRPAAPPRHILWA